MAKRESKVSIIHNYLDTHPTATWKVAKADLEKLGVKSGYFSIQKSKWKAGVSPKNATRGASKGKTKRTAAVTRSAKGKAGDNELGKAVEFARTVGGIKSAQELLNQLASVQVR